MQSSRKLHERIPQPAARFHQPRRTSSTFIAAEGNWSWRYQPERLTADLAETLAALVTATDLDGSAIDPLPSDDEPESRQEAESHNHEAVAHPESEDMNGAFRTGLSQIVTD